MSRRVKLGIIGGCALTLLGLVFLNTDFLLGLQEVTGNLDLAQSHALCSSVVGQFEQSFNAQGAANCSKISHYYDFSLITLWSGVAITAVSVLRALRGRI